VDGWRRRLALVLGIVFILDGIAETVRAIRSGDGGLLFWFGSLCGGGTLILVATFALSRRLWLSFSLTAVGCLAAAIATMWTLILPLLATLLLVLALLRAIHGIQPVSSDLASGPD
jgi:hypothetical protein